MKIVILSRKNLQYNTRVERQAKAFVQAGHQVQIVTLHVADLPLYEKKEGYEIIRLQLHPWHHRLRQTLSNIWNTSMQAPQRVVIWAKRVFSRSTMGQGDATATKHPDQSLTRSFALTGKAIAISNHEDGLRNIAPSLAKRTLRFLMRLMMRPVANPLKTLHFACRAYQTLKDHPADCYQSHDSQALLAAYLLARRHRGYAIYDAVEIITDRSATQWGKFGTWVGRKASRVWEGFFIRRTNLVLTPTPVIANILRKRYKVTPHLLMNCTWFKQAEELQLPAGRDLRSRLHRPDCKILFYSGGISAANGVDYLIRCLRYLPKEVILILMGPIQKRYEEQCRHVTQSENVRDRVLILEPVPPNQVPCYAASADVGVVAYQAGSLNNYATLPNKFFEYIMARIPVAAADFPSLREIILQEDIGRLYKPSDLHDMARAILEILEPATYKRLKINLERAAKKYSWENQARKLVQLYESSFTSGGSPISGGEAEDSCD